MKITIDDERGSVIERYYTDIELKSFNTLYPVLATEIFKMVKKIDKISSPEMVQTVVKNLIENKGDRICILSFSGIHFYNRVLEELAFLPRYLTTPLIYQASGRKIMNGKETNVVSLDFNHDILKGYSFDTVYVPTDYEYDLRPYFTYSKIIYYR
jgi:hypothetical protein